jgi:hypothetical protein
MACKNTYRNLVNSSSPVVNFSEQKSKLEDSPFSVPRLLFGVDSKVSSSTVLQNNLNQFEWVLKNKLYPVFWGRVIVGENALTVDEIHFLHKKGCKIAPICYTDSVKKKEAQGYQDAERMVDIAIELDIPEGVAIFLELSETETVTDKYLKGFILGLAEHGYTAGFKANTDAKFCFDREFSRGMQVCREMFETSLVWAVAPTVEDYNRMTNSHLIHPDNWVPFAPSGITRKDISVWQYGKDCHPIADDNDKEVTFNLDLVRNDKVIFKKMF